MTNFRNHLPEYGPISLLKDLEMVKIYRFCLNAHFDKIAIVGFADSSTAAHGAAVYSQISSVRSTLNLLASKPRVAFECAIFLDTFQDLNFRITL